MNKSRVNLALVITLSMGVLTAHAELAYLDKYTVTRGSSTVFNDEFNDGVAPVIGLQYSAVDGIPAGSEAGGKLALDPLHNGILQANGTSRVSAMTNGRYYLMPRITTFSSTAFYNLSMPSPSLWRYGAMAIEFEGGYYKQQNFLTSVSYEPDGKAYVIFGSVVGAGLADVIGRSLLDMTHSSIALTLSHVGGTGTIEGSYQYYDAGSAVGSAISLGSTSLGAKGTGYLSGYFANAAPVPEPETYAMLMAGLGLLGAVARKRKTQQQ